MMTAQYARCMAGLLIVVLVSCNSNVRPEEPVSHVLKYEIDPNAVGETTAARMQVLATRLDRRLEGKGKARVVGDRRIDVDLFGKVDAAELERIQRRISLDCKLEFRITADRHWHRDTPYIEGALKLPPNGSLMDANPFGILTFIVVPAILTNGSSVNAHATSTRITFAPRI